jgi:phosphoserine phosphatase
LFDGARETVHELKRRGFRLGVISGTIDIVLDTLFPDHPFDEVHTNEIFFDEQGRLAGWRATPFDIDGKPIALKKIAGKHGIPLSRTAYVGDGENDIPLLGVAGFFVAFRPKTPRLAEGADMVIGEEGLGRLLDVFR